MAGRARNDVRGEGKEKGEMDANMPMTTMNLNIKADWTYLSVWVSIHGRAGTVGAGTRISSRGSCLVLHRPVSEDVSVLVPPVASVCGGAWSEDAGDVQQRSFVADAGRINRMRTLPSMKSGAGP